MFSSLIPKKWRNAPHRLIAENHAFFSFFDQTRPINEYSFVVCDTELTGLDRKNDEIISIGAVIIRDLQIDLGISFHRYIRPQKNGHTRATLVHQITPQQLAAAPPLEEVLPAFVEFTHGSLLVGHHLGLDMEFINRATRRTMGGIMSNPGIDTIRLAQGYQRTLEGHFKPEEGVIGKYTLENLTRRYHLPAFPPHDALEDAMQTAYLFLFLIKKFRKGGLTTLKDIYRAVRVNRL